MLLCSVAGFDASHQVDDLASAMGKPCTPIALGKSLLFICVLYYMLLLHNYAVLCFIPSAT